METAELLQNALKRIEALEIQVADLRGVRLVSDSPTAKPVNRAAYQKALDALMTGDRKALREYRKHYAIPGTSRPSMGNVPDETKTQTRGRAVATRKAHNLQVVGSNPAPR